MIHWTALFTMSSLACLTAFAGTFFLIKWLNKKNILDIPDERTNHSVPTPRGGGIAVISTILLFLIIASFYHEGLFAKIMPIIIGATILSILSWIDDKRGLSPLIRFSTQIITISIITLFFMDKALFNNDYIPYFIMVVFVIILWTWFLNLFNFMDGINGITSVETISICVGIVAIVSIKNLDSHFAFISALCASSILGFLFWNWGNAKIFLGDVGSISMGFILGWLMLEIASKGYWSPMIILSLYYLFDSTYTITKRLLKKEKIWLPHSQHFYQKAVRSGKSHANVTTAILITNIALIILAIVTSIDLKYNIEGLILASIILWGLISYLQSNIKSDTD